MTHLHAAPPVASHRPCVRCVVQPPACLPACVWVAACRNAKGRAELTELESYLSRVDKVGSGARACAWQQPPELCAQVPHTSSQQHVQL